MPFKNKPLTNMITPSMCSNVHVLGNMAKLRKIVAALRVVVVMDMVRAPNRFVIAAAQDPPNIPRVENRNTAMALFLADQLYS